MGLAGPKKRIKLSHDPNNTTWTNDTQSFGHKIMTSQGWTPGQYLGAQDAAHAEFHTAANASHIRVTLKDDNLGLGAKIGSGVGHGECTGLDVFKNILGRLNGKDELEIEKEQKSRDDLKRALYTERKWGSIRFVKGGFLVGDKIQLLIDGEAERVRKLEDGSDSSDSDSSSEAEEEEPVEVEEVKKSKKRKAEALVENAPEVVAVNVKKSKKKSKSESRPEQEVVAALSDIKLSKKSKKERKPKEAVEESNESSDESESKRRKREKKERKQEREAKRERKEKKKKAKLEVEDGSTKSKSKKSKREKSKSDESSSSGTSTKESTPSVLVTAPSSGRSTPMMQGRHAVRARNIAQKRLASMDVASLNQIFMIKS